MKCEHCGKNEVTFVYQSNINGKVTEKHLCGECARELGYSQRIAAPNQNMMQHFFGDSFFGGSLLDDFFAPMPSRMSRMNRTFPTNRRKRPSVCPSAYRPVRLLRIRSHAPAQMR